MLAEVVAAAAADSGAGQRLLDRSDALCTVRYVSAEHRDPSAMVAKRLGIEPELRIHSSIGGDTPQVAIAELSRRIAAGELDIAVVCGCEALATFAKQMKAGTDPGWTDELPDSIPSELLGSERDPNTAEEISAGMIAPLMIYPLFESALWARSGESLGALTERLGRLQERYARVARDNPYAWSKSDFEAEQISTASPTNRQVTVPYTKLMNANIQTDQAAAVIICSESAANDLGVAKDRRVYLHGASRATEPWYFSERDDLGSSPALGEAAAAAFAQAGTDADGVGLLDVYSCFPSAIQIAGNELGIDLLNDSRDPTVTGGLAFAGGPGNAYVLHSVAAMIEQLREQPDELGLVTAVGWYMTKHAVGIYGCRPPNEDFVGPTVIDEPLAARSVAPIRWTGKGTAETATVLFERDGSPSMGLLTALLDGGTRALSSTTDRETVESMLNAPVGGRPLTLDAERGFWFN